MTTETILAVLAGGICLIAIIQLAMIVKLAQAVGKMAETAQALQKQADPVVQQTREALVAVKPVLEQARETVASIKPLLEQVRETLANSKPLIEQARATAAAVGPILEQTQHILANTRETTQIAKQTVTSLKIEAEACMAAVTTTTREIAQITLEEVQDVQTMVHDTTDRVRMQLERYDRVVTRTALRIDDTAALVQRDVLRPLAEISALLAATKTFLQVLFAAERKQIDQAYQDEEMFI